MRRSLYFCGLFAIAACHGGDVRQSAPRAHLAQAAATLEIVESAPIETTLDHADIRNAADVWPEMIDRATRTIDLAEFYASDDAGSKLTPVIEAIERAAARGVRVRFLVEKIFVKQYPETLDRLRAAKVDVRIIDWGARTGGILHAKYFVVDARESFIGSQNFDWRALAHIQEMGVRVVSPRFAGYLEEVFEKDWPNDAPPAPRRDRCRLCTTAEYDFATEVEPIATTTGERLSLLADPIHWLPDDATWELPRLVGAIGSARRGIDVHVLTYATKNRDGSPFTALDDALRAAAARGVKVRLLVSHWALKGHAREAIDALSNVRDVEVRVLTVPPWSGGDIPFARVSHAKFAIFDRVASAWVGTSNWEGDYFLRSRNVGVMIDGGRAPKRLEGVFEEDWNGPYTKSFGAP